MPCFAEDPNIALLRSLARGSLKQNLLRALRLWVWLRVLYADLDEGVSAPADPFTFAEWRTHFFSESHPPGETMPPLHDPACACARTVHDWLELLTPELDLRAWKESLRQQDCLPTQFDAWCNQRLFGVTRRSLDEDLRILTKLSWVNRQKQSYQRVKAFPNHPSLAAQIGHPQPLIHPDLAAIAHNLAPAINGYRRFFLHVEYVVPPEATDRVDDWQALLRQIWEQIPVPPIQLTFYSARLDAICMSIVYPVCVYYAQRASYLCAWGQLPDDDKNLMDWRNYRLDRIHAIQPLSWSTSVLPKALHQAYQQNQLPTPDTIQERMIEAWGFDFYQPADTLLLRFDQDFAKRYINNSLRHETFTAISYPKAKTLIQSNTSAEIRRKLFGVLEARSPDDAYYTAQYRRHDLNILLRLRAWRPSMEVLLPWDLRQQIAAEVRQEKQFYDEVESRSSSSKV